MQYELAPMEGLTTWVFRTVYHRHFTPADRYFTPFLAPNMSERMNAKELREALPEHNVGMTLVPQLLTNRADHFLSTCRQLRELGYDEVNLNLGCPSGTVVAKHKGAGFLSQLDALERFLDEIFDLCPMQISIKTRIGHYSDDEWPRILALYCRYPLSELIVHPRNRTDFYRNTPRRDAFALAQAQCPFPVTYNGDLFTRAQIDAFGAQFPRTQCVMVGRGVLCNPWLLGGQADKAQLRAFVEDLFDAYHALYGSAPQALSKLKGVWNYLMQSFTNYAPYLKSVRKERYVNDYLSTVNSLFHNEDLIPDACFDPSCL